MGKFFVKANQIEENKIKIIGSDVNHIKNVLRLKVDDDINVCNSDDQKNYICAISNINSNEIECTILKEVVGSAEGKVSITIYQGLPKADKMELIIQKGTELGVKEFIPVNFKRCIVKLDSKDEAKKIERWNKIAEVASKQSGRDIVPNVGNILNLKQIVDDFEKYDLVLLCYEDEKNNLIKNELVKIKESQDAYKIAVIIGPEGGIDSEEVDFLRENGAKVVSLGSRILRTETVALMVSSVIMYELES